MPVNNEYHLEYANEVYQALLEAGIRVELDSRDEKLGYRMREAQTKKVPVSLVLGNNERDEKTVTLRIFGSEEKTTMALSEFVEFIKDKKETHALTLN